MNKQKGCDSPLSRNVRSTLVCDEADEKTQTRYCISQPKYDSTRDRHEVTPRCDSSQRQTRNQMLSPLTDTKTQCVVASDGNEVTQARNHIEAENN